MKEHLDDGQIQALLDKELDKNEASRAREHLAGCPVCRPRFAKISDANFVLATALGKLDPLAISALPPRLSAPPSVARSGERWSRRQFARAAAMLLVFAAGASATIPGSPLREWLTGRSGDKTPVDGAVDTVAQNPVESVVPDDAGVSVSLVNGVFRVRLSEAAPGASINARLVDGSQGGVYQRGGGASARFRTSAGTIDVGGGWSGELRVEIPGVARVASIELDGRVILTKDGDQLRLLSPDTGSASAEIFFRVAE